MLENEEVVPDDKNNTVGFTTWIFDEGTFRPAAKIVDGERFSIITDYLGTPIEMYNAAGKKTWEVEYDIYGKVRKSIVGSIEDCPFRYQGQYEDQETGLYYNRFRYYAPDEGVYISQDPIGLAGGMPNMYAYVHDSNAFIDPFGLDCTPKTKKSSYDGASRRDAFRQAKRDAGIGQSQQPSNFYKENLLDAKKKPMNNEDGLIKTRNYEFTKSNGDVIVIQEHSLGHQYPDGVGTQGPHFNVRPIDNLDTGNVGGTHGHYNF